MEKSFENHDCDEGKENDSDQGVYFVELSLGFGLSSDFVYFIVFFEIRLQ